MAQYSGEFYQRGVKLLGLSCDDVQSHNKWIKDIEAHTVSLFPTFHTQIKFSPDVFMKTNINILLLALALHVAWCQGELSNHF